MEKNLNIDLDKRLERFRLTAEKFAAESSRLPAESANPQQRAHAARYFKDSNCPSRHVDRKEFQGSAWMATLNFLCGRLHSGCLIALIGTNGPGKTQLGVECIRHMTSDLFSARYATAMDFFIELKKSYRKDSMHDEGEVLNLFARPRLLVLDECQERGETEWEDRILTYLIDRRYRDQKDTILISNLKREEFEASLGRSVISRLNETGGIIECTWPSFRKYE